MPTFTITRGLNVRRYFDATIEADTPEQAFAIGEAMIRSGTADGWSASKFGHAPMDDLTEPTMGADEALCVHAIDDLGGEPAIDFADVPNADEPAGYSALLNFARQVANLETWEDRIKRECDEDGITDAEGIEQYRDSADKDLDYLEAQYETLEKLTALARAMLAFPKTDTEA